MIVEPTIPAMKSRRRIADPKVRDHANLALNSVLQHGTAGIGRANSHGVTVFRGTAPPTGHAPIFEALVHNAEKRIWVTPKEAIRISGIKRTRLYELINDGTIKSIKLGGKRLVSYASIEAGQ